MEFIATMIANAYKSEESDFQEWFDLMKNAMDVIFGDFNTWMTNEKETFTTWFNNVKGQLGTDVAGHLQNQLDAMLLTVTQVDNKIDELSGQTLYMGAQGNLSTPTPSNADLLGGQKPEYYAKEADSLKHFSFLNYAAAQSVILTSYTAPANGILYPTNVYGSVAGVAYLSVNDITVGIANYPGAQVRFSLSPVILRAGDIVKLTGPTFDSKVGYWIPCV